MGGTFDPIHNGHLVAASEVAHRFELDEVIFVPTGRPWQKLGEHTSVSPPEDRYLMTVIATASNPQFSVSRVDIDRDGDTYTVDTLRDLRRQLPDAQLYFITGADALESILSWQDWEELFDLARFVGVSRPGYELDATHLAQHLAQMPDDTLHLLEIPALAISSTECRTRAALGRPVWYLVPDGVVQYIAKRKLYRAPRASSPGVSAPGAERAGGRSAAPGAERAGGSSTPSAPGAERAGGSSTPSASGAERAGVEP
ncbi:putative nicotinate-nucleotide adenylyltransferase [Gordonia rubripertincta NBRC 101908]|nr:putative nicotinate-nucleotide adenylyltransferase [Gordonia rubripertincta NBRC 101908]